MLDFAPIDVLRESHAPRRMGRFQQNKARAPYHDPGSPPAMTSSHLHAAVAHAVDAFPIVTDHATVEYDRVAAQAPRVADTHDVVRWITRRASGIRRRDHERAPGMPELVQEAAG